MNKYPIYVISKGRWSRPSTINTLNSMGVSFKVVVEPSEYKEYSKILNCGQIIQTPEDFSKQGNGSIPVRNFVWDHSLNNGDEKHWILDDNIESVERFNKNMKVKVFSDAPFKCIEDFTDRYENVGLSGMNYAFFIPACENRPPININTRVYSCILIKNDLPFRWRGRYNEDTDLSLRVLKAGYCTLLFNAFLIGKRASMTQDGGNEEIYKESNNRKDFAESLANQHPDVARVVERFGRYHHQVNYKLFKGNRLIYKDNVKLNRDTNNYGMTLKPSNK